MEEADALLAVGTRAVCQSDSSRTGYPKVEHVVAVNADLRDAIHYGGAVALVGDAAATLDRLARAMEALPRKEPTGWAEATAARKAEWAAYRAERYACPTLPDPVWGGPVLTQPAAIKAATDWARSRGVVSFFDAGDVQAHGFQIVEDERVGQTFTETGASYMGFAASAVLATAMAGRPFRALALTGDGSFLMNPQILVDGVAHGARGTVLILDNRRMAAISGLQVAQHGHDYATWDHVPVDWVAVAGAVRGVKALDGGRSVESLVAALEEAHGHEGLSVVHVPVYWGPDPRGGLGAFGRWNVGNWVESTQGMRHDIGR
jgi:3D-(3,5/4)-trihydroxycyclohexane-1,2-dione acylhydrolase (decyclizing)